MNCILERNPLSGMGRSHSILCLYCESDAVVHFNVGTCCGNICEKCARKRFKADMIEVGVYLTDGCDEEER